MSKISIVGQKSTRPSTYSQAGNSEEYKRIESEISWYSRTPTSQLPSVWLYLTENSDPSVLEAKLQRIVALLDDGCSVFKGPDLGYFNKLVSQENVYTVNLVFEMLEALICSQEYQTRALLMIESNMLYSSKPEIRYAALELISNILEVDEAQRVLESARNFFSTEEKFFVKEYFDDLLSSTR